MIDETQQNAIPEPEKLAPHAHGFSKGVLFTVASTGVSVLSLFLETMIAARLLPPDDYGVYLLLLVVVLFYGVIVDFGGKTATTQMIAGGERDRQIVVAGTALLFRLLVVGSLSLLIWLAGDWQVVFDPSRSMLQYSAYIPLMLAAFTFDELLLGILQGFQLYKRLAVAQITRSVLRMAFTTFFLLVLHLGVLALIYSWILSYAICVVYEFAVTPIPKRLVFQRPMLSELLRFGAPLQATRIAWFLLYRIDVLLLSAFGGPLAVAFYGVANRVPEALNRVVEAYITVYFPTVSSLLANQRQKQAHWFLNHSLRLVSFLSACAAIVAVVFNREIVTLLFSEKYQASSPAFALLMIAFHMTFIVNLMGYTLTAARRAGMSFATNLLRTVNHILAALALIPIFGFMGSALAANISAYINNPASVLMLRRIGIKVAVLPYTKQTALLLGCAGLYWWLQPQSFVLSVGIVALFVILNWLLATISLEDFSLILPARIIRRRAVMPREAVAEGSIHS